MPAKRMVFLTVTLAAAVALSGCSTFTVKNTDGLQLAYEDIDRASSYASRLKSAPQVPADERNEAVGLYIDTKGKINSYLEKAITDAADYEVNNPREEYLASGAREKEQLFEKKVTEATGRQMRLAPDAWSPVAGAVINAIWDLNQKNREAARQKFEDTVKKYEMKNYEEIPASRYGAAADQ